MHYNIMRVYYFANLNTLSFPTRNSIGCVPPSPIMFRVFIAGSIYFILANQGVDLFLVL